MSIVYHGTVFLVFLFLLSAGESRAYDTAIPRNAVPGMAEQTVSCPPNTPFMIMSAAEELAKRDNPGNHEFEVKGSVGTICTVGENMVDVVILVDLGSGKYRYGVFHMHFSHTGRLIPTDGSSPSFWRETEDRYWWREEWCHHLKTSMQSYASELGRYGCQP